MNIWETQLGYDFVHALISKLSEKETTQKAKCTIARRKQNQKLTRKSRIIMQKFYL